jgi:homoserine kinase type II
MAVLTPQASAELEEVVRAYELGSLESFLAIDRGTVNTSYGLRLTQEGVTTPYFFRLYEEQDLGGAQAEARLLAHLRKNGAKTPAPIPRRDLALVGVHQGKPCAIFPFVAGDMRCQRAVTPGDAGKLGAEIARLHVAARGAELRPSRFGRKDLEARMETVRATAPAHLSTHVDELRDKLARIEDERARLSAEPPLMIHGDLFRDNVLFEGAEISSVLDFESAGQGSRTYDLAVALLAFSFRDRFDWEVGKALVSSYEREFDLHSVPKEALYWDACFGAVRFTVTRITDSAMRGGKKDFRRFLARQAELFSLGPKGFAEALS